MILKWCWRHSALSVEIYSSLQEAVAAAYYDMDYGSSVLYGIEEVGVRFWSASEVEDLPAWKATEEAERESWTKRRPDPKFRVEVASPDGEKHYGVWDWFHSKEEADAKVDELRSLFGERVRAVQPRQG